MTPPLVLDAHLLAAIEFTPFLGAVLIAWIFSVCLHEFAHALVAYLGGDRSVRDRGYLSLNPLNYIDPVTSILLPCIFLVIGGIPLPGDAVLIDRSRLKSRNTEAAVAAAGPAANILLFLLIAALIHPTHGLIDAAGPDPSNAARLLGVLAVLQVFAVLLNLIPIPPLDGFGIIEPYLDPDTRARFNEPRYRWMGLFALFFVLFQVGPVARAFGNTVDLILNRFGLPYDATWRHFDLIWS